MIHAVIPLVAGILFATSATGQQHPDDHKRPKRRVCAATIAGAAGMQVGFTTTIIGFAMRIEAGAKAERSGLPQSIVSEEYERDRKRATTVTGVGAGLFVAGTVSLIAGRIIDKEHNTNLTVISPRMNEIGLAYRF